MTALEELQEKGYTTCKDWEAENLIKFIGSTFRYRRTWESGNRVTVEITGTWGDN